MTVKLAIFDCDGTMVDGQANICRAMEMAFGHENLPAPDHHVTRRIVGLSIGEAMAVLAPQLNADVHMRLAEEYKRSYQQMRATGTMAAEPLYEGLVDLFDRLESAGWLLAVATGKSDRGLNMVLAHFGLAERFVSLQTADRHPSKPHPSMIDLAMADAGAERTRTVMIGDTIYDMEMGRNAGVRSVGVEWGYHGADELLASGADVVAAQMADLFGILEGASNAHG